jgi:hypothetical protein
MTDEADSKKGPLARLVEVIEKHKKKSWAILIVFVVGLITSVSSVGQIASDVWSVFTNAQSERDAPTSLALGDAVSSVDSRLGEPRQSFELCDEITCEPTEAHQPLLNVYRHEDYTVRAVFDGNKLEFYAVTRESEKYKPHLKMPFDWGELGEFTYKQASSITSEPDDLDAFERRFLSYAEVKSLGAPNFQGIVLGHAPDGYSDEQSRDSEAQRALDDALLPSKGPREQVAAAELFRATSRPNTQGIFNDDGFVGSLLRNAEYARQIISVGAER